MDKRQNNTKAKKINDENKGKQHNKVIPISLHTFTIIVIIAIIIIGFVTFGIAYFMQNSNQESPNEKESTYMNETNNKLEVNDGGDTLLNDTLEDDETAQETLESENSVSSESAIPVE